jgi:SNF2 family DNA or RNA helicase
LDAIKPITFQLTDVYQLPDLMINNVIVRLPSQARAIYDKLKRELVINDEVIENVITKLQQVADGFAYQSDGSYIPIHEAKLEAFDEIMESQQGAPTLVIYKYRAELELMKACHPGPHLDSRVEAKPIIDAWNAGKLPVLYVHPASAGHGLNLQDGGNTIVWYGQTWSMEEHEQTIARLRRRGQKKTVWCHYILAADTIDMKLREAVKRKLNVFELAKEMMYS